jgi:transcriptional regulator with XRE-family HTH domain
MTERPRIQDGRVSTGIPELDLVLQGLFWGDNVVWELDGVAVTPFYEAILTFEDGFDDLTWITLGAAADNLAAAFPHIEVVDARPTCARPGPVELLRHVAERCDPRRRNLILFDGLDCMVESWGADLARRFFARCCPMLLELGAIAYWSMNTREVPSSLREVVEAVTQCVLRVDERSLVVVKAEGRAAGARGSLMHWQHADGQLELSATGVGGQVAASLRALRRSRGMNQHQLADLAAVTPSAISQAERAERSLSLATLVRLAAALGITVDDLLSGENPAAYQIGRRTDDPRLAPEAAEALLAGGRGRPSVDLIRVGPHKFSAPPKAVEGHGLTAVCAGLVQVHIGEITPVIRHGEVLMSDAARVDGWQNLRDREAMLFWIVSPATALASEPSDGLWGQLI